MKKVLSVVLALVLAAGIAAAGAVGANAAMTDNQLTELLTKLIPMANSVNGVMDYQVDNLGVYVYQPGDRMLGSQYLTSFESDLYDHVPLGYLAELLGEYIESQDGDAGEAIARIVEARETIYLGCWGAFDNAEAALSSAGSIDAAVEYSRGRYNALLSAAKLPAHFLLPATFTLTYDPNGGTGGPSPRTGIAPGTTVTLSTTAPIKPGDTFKGWAATPTGTTKITQVTVNANTTVYAIWAKNGGGGGGTTENFTLWGKPTNWAKSPLNWFLLIVCFGWIWMAF